MGSPIIAARAPARARRHTAAFSSPRRRANRNFLATTSRVGGHSLFRAPPAPGTMLKTPVFSYPGVLAGTDSGGRLGEYRHAEGTGQRCDVIMSPPFGSNSSLRCSRKSIPSRRSIGRHSRFRHVESARRCRRAQFSRYAASSPMRFLSSACRRVLSAGIAAVRLPSYTLMQNERERRRIPMRVPSRCRDILAPECFP